MVRGDAWVGRPWKRSPGPMFVCAHLPPLSQAVPDAEQEVGTWLPWQWGEAGLGEAPSRSFSSCGVGEAFRTGVASSKCTHMVQ